MNATTEIIWPTRPGLKDENLWKHNLEVVQMLSGMGEIIEWTNDYNGSTHFPRKYSLYGIDIEFLPHWGFYEVGRHQLAIPKEEGNILDAIIVVQGIQPLEEDLRHLGWNPSP